MQASWALFASLVTLPSTRTFSPPLLHPVSSPTLLCTDCPPLSKNPQLADLTAAAAVQKKFLQFSSNSSHVDQSAVISPEDFFLLCWVGDKTRFAAEIFHDLHEQLRALRVRSDGLTSRLLRLETELPAVEKALRTSTDQFRYAYIAGRLAHFLHATHHAAGR